MFFVKFLEVLRSENSSSALLGTDLFSNPKNVLKMVASEIFFKVNSTPDNVPKNV